MGLQTGVNFFQATGIIGEISNTAPLRVTAAYYLNSPTPANNVIGRAFTARAENQAEAGMVTAVTQPFLGILALPKTYANDNGNLDPTLTLANNTQVEIVREGIMWVYLETAAVLGAQVYYENSTGKLSAQAHGSTIPTLHNFAFAEVIEFATAAAGLAKIHIDFNLPVPPEAASPIGGTELVVDPDDVDPPELND